MYDKRVRRRRAVLVLLVVLSLVLLTASFGSSKGPLQGFQDGVLAIVSPIEDGASKALKPVRDLFGWVGDTLHAKGRLATVTKERDALRREVVGATAARAQNRQLSNLIDLDQNTGIDSYSPLAANVIGRSPTLWYATIRIDKGSDDGVRDGQPVVGDGALVGKISDVSSGSASVTLITDHTSAVQAKVNETGDYGVLRPDVGDPNQLLLDYVYPPSKVHVGDRVVTSGTVGRGDSKLPSLFPQGIPIGSITAVHNEGANLALTIHVSPYADLRRFDVVQVLTKNVPGVRAQVSP